MNQHKTKIILKNESRIQVYVLEKIAANTNSPVSSFKPKENNKITDYILSRDERLLIYLTRYGHLGIIDFIKNSTDLSFELAKNPASDSRLQSRSQAHVPRP